jgi:hypothetical protein
MFGFKFKLFFVIIYLDFHMFYKPFYLCNFHYNDMQGLGIGEFNYNVMATRIQYFKNKS